MAFFPDIVSLGSPIWHADGAPVDTLEALTIASDLDHRARRSSQIIAQFDATFPLILSNPFLDNYIDLFGSPTAHPEIYWTVRGTPTGGSAWILRVGDHEIDFNGALDWQPWIAADTRPSLTTSHGYRAYIGIVAEQYAGSGTLEISFAARTFAP